jgi:hypothetical protein
VKAHAATRVLALVALSVSPICADIAHESEVDGDEPCIISSIGSTHWSHVGGRGGFAPAVNLDLVDGRDAFVYGLNFEVVF